MSGLRPPGLGPIIGHTTHNSCRLWIQAGDPEDKPGEYNANRRTIGVIGLLAPDGKSIVKAFYFRLHREFDRTGTFDIGKDVNLGRHESDGVPPAERDTPVSLQSDTAYAVRMATLSLDDPSPDGENVLDRDLAKRLPPIANIQDMLLELDAEDCQVTFRTFPDPGSVHAKLSFLLGSCRYPGLLWKVKEADKVFGPMLPQFGNGRAASKPEDFARFTLMVGDQVYADMLNRFIPLGLADTYEEFQERYRSAFGSPNMRQLLKTAPTYMILDDHEIEDNWSQDRIRDDGKHRIFNFAIGAYMSYQWSHSPRTYGRLLYYNFDCAGYPFFVVDTRTQRFKDDAKGLDDNHLLGRPTIDPVHPGQLKRLLEWLEAQQQTRGNVPKFIASSSVFAPNSMDERIDDPTAAAPDKLYKVNRNRRDASDSWPAYPKTRKAILDHIVGKKIRNVVFLTGDIHCSNIAELSFESVAGSARTPIDLRAHDITSSAFYWPFPFADGDPNTYVHDSRADDQYDPFPIRDGEMHYKAWAFTQEDNFCRLDIDKARSTLTVRYFDRGGAPVRVADRSGQLVTENVLALASW